MFLFAGIMSESFYNDRMTAHTRYSKELSSILLFKSQAKKKLYHLTVSSQHTYLDIPSSIPVNDHQPTPITDKQPHQRRQYRTQHNSFRPSCTLAKAFLLMQTFTGGGVHVVNS